MPLTPAQEDATRAELKESFEKSGLTLAQAAKATGTSTDVIERTMKLDANRLEDPWILKNLFNDTISAKGAAPVIFSALKGDFHKYWFLNARIIERGQIA